MAWRQANQVIGFVPTMGALHQGHLSLIFSSKKENQKTVCSIFVNPTQFNNPEDFEKYPVSMEEDLHMLEKAGCDLVFVPSAQEMYPNLTQLRFQFGALGSTMEGAFRPGHFHGVALVVLKLFNLVLPNRAYFGQKDFQQYLIIKHLVDSLFLNIELRCMPIIREENGLAMSSRNRRLSKEGKDKAGIIYQALELSKELFSKNISISEIQTEVLNLFKLNEVEIEYFQMIDTQDISKPIDHHTSEIAICIAAYIEGVRLIDNTLLTLNRN